jgi:hypothetical protein
MTLSFSPSVTSKPIQKVSYCGGRVASFKGGASKEAIICVVRGAIPERILQPPATTKSERSNKNEKRHEEHEETDAGSDIRDDCERSGER